MRRISSNAVTPEGDRRAAPPLLRPHPGWAARRSYIELFLLDDAWTGTIGIIFVGCSSARARASSAIRATRRLLSPRVFFLSLSLSFFSLTLFVMFPLRYYAALLDIRVVIDFY